MATKTTKTIYITKYALTAGIITAHAEVDEDGYAVVRATKPGTFDGFFGKSDYRDTVEDAVKRATDLKTKKINALRAQMLKLKDLDVTAVKPMGA